MSYFNAKMHICDLRGPTSEWKRGRAWRGAEVKGREGMQRDGGEEKRREGKGAMPPA